MDLPEIFKIKGVMQNYSWGGECFLPHLVGIQPDGNTYAEYWMGDHIKGPSIVENNGQSLKELIEQKPIELLGYPVFKKFGRLPYLFKVLDVNDMLSIQVHPSKKEAEKGYTKENEKGIPLNSSYRNYKDNNHKPEIMVALSEFWLLHGFLSDNDLGDNLKQVPELAHLLPVFKEGSIKKLYQQVMLEPQSETDKVLSALKSRLLSSKLEWNKSSPEYWAKKAFESFCIDNKMDKGIYSIFFFNIVKLNPGEAIFQDAGIPHAYLEGQNMELMANSDNVLRGGLTQKNVDVPELLRNIKFESILPVKLEGELQSDNIERVYKSPAKDFELSQLSLSVDSLYSSISNNLEIFIVLEGEVVVSGHSLLKLNKGEVFGVKAGAKYTLKSNESAIIYKAKCPVEL
ncbi:mannose-6-phosphate isomerase, class I [Mangrovivirga sp. M17]|uniref:mannose-6-phosphate isomerase n=1 Tax=Mangrovivirga halotolerans TaxID=2993936 RepID=A0ABT3RKC5_9BACT|nr:mannose-6-phosphate isomerase, class I [Mangrovivirga halotolerans]MCX2742259.1 mannose-6-phosphate isomerase, class I [Mangrovivirga halotolerans]